MRTIESGKVYSMSLAGGGRRPVRAVKQIEAFPERVIVLDLKRGIQHVVHIQRLREEADGQ